MRKRFDGAALQIAVPLQYFFVRNLKAGCREGLEQTPNQPGAQRFRQSCRLILNLFHVHGFNITTSWNSGKSGFALYFPGRKSKHAISTALRTRIFPPARAG